MLMLITLLNDGTLITIAYDYAKASTLPTRWNLPVLFVISSVLGAVSCVSSLGLLPLLLNSWDPNGLWQKLGMDGLQYGQVSVEASCHLETFVFVGDGASHSLVPLSSSAPHAVGDDGHISEDLGERLFDAFRGPDRTAILLESQACSRPCFRCFHCLDSVIARVDFLA
jgi:hypothetical protein